MNRSRSSRIGLREPWACGWATTVLSGALTRRQSPGSFLALITEGIGEGVIDGFITKTVIPAEVGKPARGGRKKKDAAPLRDLKGFEARWRAREDRWTGCRQRSLYLTPTSLSAQNIGAVGTQPCAPTKAGTLPESAAIGSLVHKALENWSYRDTVQVMLEQLNQHVERWLPDEFQGKRDEILGEARDVLQAFARSDAYAELSEATILGREVPFLMPWCAEGERVGVGGAPLVGPPPTLMEGRIDLLYKKDGTVWLADYKTDRITEPDAVKRAETYQEQARIYTEAVRHALGHRPAGFKIIFLRLGKAVPVVL
ncbi:MAG: hypothetical protein E6K59_11595 [Nitrospirae bacterium]|nr:MAG: hypothetical protein E6K59_11595 [Nitrospirota bacterium]